MQISEIENIQKRMNFKKTQVTIIKNEKEQTSLDIVYIANGNKGTANNILPMNYKTVMK